MTILTFFASAGSDSAATSSDGGGGSAFSSVGLLLLMLLAMYFLIIRPNSKKRKAHQSLQSELGVGDEVITTAGIIGTITGEDGPTRFWLEIDDDVQVRIARGGIAGRLDPDALDSEKPEGSDTDVEEFDDSADEAADRDS